MRPKLSFILLLALLAQAMLPAVVTAGPLLGPDAPDPHLVDRLRHEAGEALAALGVTLRDLRFDGCTLTVDLNGKSLPQRAECRQWFVTAGRVCGRILGALDANLVFASWKISLVRLIG